MAFNKGKYDQEYNKAHIRRKFIPFNDTNPDDNELLAWLDQQGNVTQYVKRLIRDDMSKEESRSFWETHTSFDFPWYDNKPFEDKTKLRCSMCGSIYENTGEMYEKCPSCGRIVSSQQTN